MKIYFKLALKLVFCYYGIMNIIKGNIKKWFLYLLLAFFIAVTLLTCLFFFLIDQEEKKIQQQISGFYQEAGFKGGLHFKAAELHGMSTNMPISIKKGLRERRSSLTFPMRLIYQKKKRGKTMTRQENWLNITTAG